MRTVETSEGMIYEADYSVKMDDGITFGMMSTALIRKAVFPLS